jgi:phosphoglycerate dehydrogenase-like enzyme
MRSLNIWANPFLTPSAEELLIRSIGPHKLALADKPDHVLDVGTLDERLLEADVAFGQPDPGAVIQSKNLRWVHVSSAGYTRYDTAEFRAALKIRNAIMTNSSSVYDAPCAEHVMAWMLADARQLYPSYDNQREAAGWPQNELRSNTRLLEDQTILIVGYGTIGRRLNELLAPYPLRIVGYRRTPQPGSIVEVIGPSKLPGALGEADHVVNILPDSTETRNFFNGERFHQIKPGARYYSIGRGTTTDQESLRNHLESGRLGAAYLDVTEPEPLPSDHPLWSTKNCYITPHTGGGHFNETDKIVEHFIQNLRRFEQGQELRNRVF